MADVRKVVIEIRLTDGNGTPTPSTPSEPSKPQTQSPMRTGAYGALLHQAYSNAKSAITQTIEYSASKYFSMNEDYIGEMNWNNAKTLISKAVSFGTAVAGGFAVGGVAGVAVAGIGWGVNEGIQLVQKKDTAMRQINTGNMERSYYASRTGGNRDTQN